MHIVWNKTSNSWRKFAQSCSTRSIRTKSDHISLLTIAGSRLLILVYCVLLNIMLTPGNSIMRSVSKNSTKLKGSLLGACYRMYCAMFTHCDTVVNERQSSCLRRRCAKTVGSYRNHVSKSPNWFLHSDFVHYSVVSSIRMLSVWVVRSQARTNIWIFCNSIF